MPRFKEEVLTALRFPEAHRKRVRTTNLLERLFGEGRRRTKVIPRFMNEKSGLGLMFAVLVDASASWHGIKITPAIGQELEGLRKNSGQNLRVNWLPDKVTRKAFLGFDKLQAI
jgi:putative transposase